MARLSAVETDLRDLLDVAPLRDRVVHLRCFRGIDDFTALTIAAELGDPRRFPTAPSVTAFVGLVPSEHSSGGKRARGAITKTGNAHLRRVLVEAAWHYRITRSWASACAPANRRRRHRAWRWPGPRNNGCAGAFGDWRHGERPARRSSQRWRASSPAFSGQP